MSSKHNHPAYAEGQDTTSFTKGNTRSGSVSKTASMVDQPTETSPLLRNNDSERGEVIDLPKCGLIYSRKAITWIMLVCVLVLSFGDQLTEAPLIRLMESVICYRYYEETDPSKIQLGRDVVGPGAIGGVSEMYCKADEIQSTLANIRGYQQFFDGFPSLLLAVPFGWAADRFGRKPVVMLGLLAFVVRAAWVQFVLWFWQSFDIRWTWLSTLHGFMGGSSPVTTTLLYVVLSDITPQAERAAVFLRLGASNIMAVAIIPPFAAWLMTFNPWIPALMGTLILSLSVLMYIPIPETKDYDIEDSTHPPTPPPEPVPAGPDLMDSPKFNMTSLTSRWSVSIKNSTSFLTHDWRIIPIIVLFLGHQLLGVAGAFLTQVCSKRYFLTVSNATVLLTVYNSVRAALLLIILPAVTMLVTKYYKFSAEKKDLYLTRGSFILLTAGWLLMGLSPNVPSVAVAMVVASLGQGGYSLLRSFLTSLVPAHHVARVYAIISIFDTLGAMLGGPMLSILFKRGMKLGGLWIGLPFYFVAISTAVFTVVMFFIPLRQNEEDWTRVDDDDEEERQ